jgi:hypothetical protein
LHKRQKKDIEVKNMLGGLSDVEKAIDVGEKGFGLLSKFLFPKKTSEEEARAYLIELIKADKPTTPHEMQQNIARIALSHIEIKNLVKVFKGAEPLLKGDPKIQDCDPDWLHYFIDKAKGINSPEFQNLWSKILAEELNEQNSVDKKMMDTVSMMNAESANSFTCLCRMIVQYEESIYDTDEETIKRDGIRPFLLITEDVIAIIDKLYARGLYGHGSNLFGEYIEVIEKIKSCEEILEDLGLIQVSRNELHWIPKKDNDEKPYSITIIYPVTDEPVNDTSYFFSKSISRRQIADNEVKQTLGYLELTHSGKQLFKLMDYFPLPNIELLIKEHFASCGYAIPTK